MCPNCGKHFKFDARERIENLLEPGYELVDLELRSTDPLEFTDLKPYKARLAAAQKKTGLNDAIINAVGKIGEQDVVLSVMEYGFIGGSMGAVVGETIARAVDRALAKRKSADHRLGQRRRAHDGGHRQPDAAGEGFGRRWRRWTTRRFRTSA